MEHSIRPPKHMQCSRMSFSGRAPLFCRGRTTENRVQPKGPPGCTGRPIVSRPLATCEPAIDAVDDRRQVCGTVNHVVGAATFELPECSGATLGKLCRIERGKFAFREAGRVS